MPEEQQDELRNFTLSREMVYNVFRQFLYDQESDKSEPMYIDPVSLNMVWRNAQKVTEKPVYLALSFKEWDSKHETSGWCL